MGTMQLTAADVVLVTGGASGLGAATARALARTGARVVIIDLPGAPGEELVAELGSGASFAPADVRDDAQVQHAIDIAAGFGALRVAVNCAGIGTPGRI